MGIYTVSKQSFAKIRRELIMRLVIISGLIFGGIVGWEFWQHRRNGEGELLTLVLIVVVLIGASIYGISKAIAQQQAIWNSIAIRLGNDYISRQQIRVPEVKIYRSEISKIEENRAGIWVKTSDRGRTIVIPAQLDRADYLEIKETLIGWQGAAITQAKSNRIELIFAVAYLVAFVALFFAFNIWLHLIIASIILAYNIYTYRLIKKNVALDPQFRKTYNKALMTTTFIVLANTFAKVHLLSEIKHRKPETHQNPQTLLLRKNQQG